MQRANNDIFDKEFLTTAASNENVSPDEAKVGTNLETIFEEKGSCCPMR